MALDILDQVGVASPCHADWDAMVGDARVRFCGHCEKNVYNLSAMPRAEAIQLIEDTEGERCIRMMRRADGTVLSSDCPVGARAADAAKDQARRQKRLALAAGLGISAAVTLRAAAAALRPAPTTCEAPVKVRTDAPERPVHIEEHVPDAVEPTTPPVEVKGEMRPPRVKMGKVRRPPRTKTPPVKPEAKRVVDPSAHTVMMGDLRMPPE